MGLFLTVLAVTAVAGVLFGVLALDEARRANARARVALARLDTLTREVSNLSGKVRDLQVQAVRPRLVSREDVLAALDMDGA